MTSAAPAADLGPVPPPVPAATFEARPARWAQGALAVLLVVAGTVYSLGIHLGLIHNYYGPAVYSMAHSWKAFFWGAFDGSTITMDKIPGAFWIQALSVRIFGWSNWSVLFPQVLQALAAVAILFATVRRWAGDVAALFAAAALATTPVVAALAHSQIVDTQLMLLTVAAAWAWTRAMQKGSGRWLALAGVLVGLGFNAKMAQAWGVLPALAIAYLLFAPGKAGRRWIQTLVAGVVTAVASLWWVIVASLVPASSRPWIDGASDNSVWTMVFEYNLLGRYETGTATQGGPGGSGGWSYLLGADVASQTGWLWPAAIIGLVLVLWLRRRAPRTDLLRASAVMWGLWLATFVVAFSAGRVAHSFYTVALAPAVAALAATAAALAWHEWTQGRRVALPLLLVPTLGWTAYLTSQFSGFRTWTLPVAIGLGVIGLVLAWLKKPQAAMVGLVALAASVLLTPAVWAASTTTSQYSGQSIGPSAGPAQSMGGGRGAGGQGDGGAGGQMPPMGQMPAGAQPPSGAPGGTQPTGTQQSAGGQQSMGGGMPGGPSSNGTSQASSDLAWIALNNPGSQYDVVALDYGTAGSYITAGGRVISVGGFTGQMGNRTLDQLKDLIAQGKVNHVVVGGQGGGMGGPGGSGGTSSAISTWVTANCTAVDGHTNLYTCKA